MCNGQRMEAVQMDVSKCVGCAVTEGPGSKHDRALTKTKEPSKWVQTWAEGYKWPQNHTD